VRVARAAEPDITTPTSDAEVVKAWFPGIHYVHLRCRDTAAQALRWHEALHSRGIGMPVTVGDGSIDFQEVRWLETIIERHERGWRTYFELHGIDVQMIEYEQFRARPLDVVAGVLSRLGLPPQFPVGWNADAVDEPDPPAAVRLAAYRDRRQGLATTVGVRADPR
jgi:LPS sulfotransferase NodH